MTLCAEYARTNFGDLSALAAQQFFRETVAMTATASTGPLSNTLSAQDRMRLILVDWLAEGLQHGASVNRSSAAVADLKKFHSATLFTAVALIDRYLKVRAGAAVQLRSHHDRNSRCRARRSS